jgi:hypothetical protein
MRTPLLLTLLFLPRLARLAAIHEGEHPEPIQHQDGPDFRHTKSEADKTGPGGEISVGEWVRSPTIRPPGCVEFLKPFPEVRDFDWQFGTIEVRRPPACLTFDALKYLTRGSLPIRGYSAESEVPLSVVVEVCEGVARKFPRSFTNAETWSRSHNTSL